MRVIMRNKTSISTLRNSKYLKFDFSISFTNYGYYFEIISPCTYMRNGFLFCRRRFVWVYRYVRYIAYDDVKLTVAAYLLFHVRYTISNNYLRSTKNFYRVATTV